MDSDAVVTRLGNTDDSGCLEIAAASLPQHFPFAICASLSGYHSEEASIDAAGGATTIIMSRLATLMVTCKLQDGTPVSRAQVFLSQTPLPIDGVLPTNSVRSSAKAAPVARLLRSVDAVVSAITDGSGNVIVPGVPQGMVYVAAEHDACVPISERNAAGPISVRGDAHVDIVFAPLLAAFAVVEDDRVLQSVARAPRHVGRDPQGIERAARVSLMLRERGGPESLVIVAPASLKDGRYSDEVLEANFRVFTERRGVTQVKVPMRRVEDGLVPDRIDLGPGMEVATANIQVCLRTPSGRDVEPHGVFLCPTADDRLWVPVSGMVPKRLPTGDYRVVSSQPWLAKEIATRTVAVSVDEKLYLSVARELVACRVLARYDNGLPVDSGRVTLVGSGEEHASWFGSALSRAVWLVPTGQFKVRIEAPGGRLFVADQVVMPTSEMVDLLLDNVK